MKHLKRFKDLNESMYSENCTRCGKPTNGVTTMSWFNDDVICVPCQEAEKNDPDYEDAKEAEREAIRNGNNNYSYIPNYKPIVRK